MDVTKYGDGSRSFGVDAMVRRADQLSQSYKVMSVPSIHVDGRYAVQAASYEELVKNTDLAVAKARGERK